MQNRQRYRQALFGCGAGMLFEQRQDQPQKVGYVVRSGLV